MPWRVGRLLLPELQASRIPDNRLLPPERKVKGMKLTARGEIVLATLAMLLLIALMGIAGWVEGGMQ